MKLTGLGLYECEVREIAKITPKDLKCFTNGFNLASIRNLLTTCKDSMCQLEFLMRTQLAEYQLGSSAYTNARDRKLFGKINPQHVNIYLKWKEQIKRGEFPMLIGDDEKSLWNHIDKTKAELAQQKEQYRETQNEMGQLRKEKNEATKRVAELEKEIKALRASYANVVPLDDFTENITLLSAADYIGEKESDVTRDTLIAMFDTLLTKKVTKEKLKRNIRKKIAETKAMDGPSVQKIDVQGDYVVTKHVDNEVNGVAAGATGIKSYK